VQNIHFATPQIERGVNTSFGYTTGKCKIHIV